MFLFHRHYVQDEQNQQPENQALVTLTCLILYAFIQNISLQYICKVEDKWKIKRIGYNNFFVFLIGISIW